MPTCKDCIHYKVCVIVENSTDKDDDYYTEYGCEDFEYKIDIIEAKYRHIISRLEEEIAVLKANLE